MILAAQYPELISKLVLIGTSARVESNEQLKKWQKQREILITGSEKEREKCF